MSEEEKKQVVKRKRTPAKLPPKSTGNEVSLQPKEGSKITSLEFKKRKLIELGMPSESVDVFTTEEQCQSIIDTLSANKAVAAVVTTTPNIFEEKPSPLEEKQTEKQWKTKAEIMMNKWLSQETVSFLVPLEPKEKMGIVRWVINKAGKRVQEAVDGTAVELVQVNGARWLVPKGVITKIPIGVAEVLENRLRLTNEAGKEFLVDREDDKIGQGKISERL